MSPLTYLKNPVKDILKFAWKKVQYLAYDDKLDGNKLDGIEN